MAQAIKSLAMAESASGAAESHRRAPPDAAPVADLLSLDATQPEDEAGAEDDKLDRAPIDLRDEFHDFASMGRCPWCRVYSRAC